MTSFAGGGGGGGVRNYLTFELGGGGSVINTLFSLKKVQTNRTQKNKHKKQWLMNPI